jgi:hypothetical protein
MPSTVIHHFSYDPESRRLRVFFMSGIVYDYVNVPAELFEQFQNTFSKGKFLNEQIKGKYAFEKVIVP